MVKIHVSRNTTVGPDRVAAALTDFSPHRLEIFTNLDRRHFQVHRVGPTWAEVTEGASVLGGIWERIRYDWSDPGTIRLESLDSNAFATGSDWLYRLDGNENGGTRVDLTVSRNPRSIKGVAVISLLRIFGSRVLGADLAKTLRAIETDQVQPP